MTATTILRETAQCQWTIHPQYGPPRQCSNRGSFRDSDEHFPGFELCTVHREAFLRSLHWAVIEDDCIARVVTQALRDRDADARAATAERLAEERRTRAASSVVYFAERDGFIKIGWSANVVKRLRDIGRGSSMIPGLTVGPVDLLLTVPGDVRSEAYFHGRFSNARIDGEWFLASEEILRFVRDVTLRRAARQANR